MPSWRSVLPCLLLVLPTAGAWAAPRKPGEVVIERGSIELEPGKKVAYEIGSLYVPENRKKPDSRLIEVGFARIKAARPTGAPPVFWLPGGPGLSVLGSLTDNDPSTRGKARLWANFSQRSADVVVLEQRGYTRRGEMLESTSDAMPLEQPGSIHAEAQAMRALAKRAITEHSGKDLSGYNIGELAADVDSLRRALGYKKISLFGGSFGSQWSLAVIRLHPDIVARAVLSSVEPLNNAFDMPSHTFAALQRIAYDADQDAGLAPYRPAGGLMEAVRTLRRRLAQEPVRVEVRDDAGKAQTVVLGLEDLQLALLSHTTEGENWPAFILSLYHGHYEAWAREVIEQRAAGKNKLIGPLIDSSLRTTAEREHQLRTDPAVEFLGTWNFEANFASAADWPTPDIGDEVRTPVASPVPVVFVQGDWDTSTPVENTLGLLPYFPNGHTIITHRGGHDGTFYLLRSEEAASQAVYEFLKTGKMTGLPHHVTLPLPSFPRPTFPPPAAGAKAGTATQRP
ncbi:TAP-like protein [Myxococcus fulvus]|uniref:TAP-like protein n=1 Tax=Myxococcus fulvus TaxID=33 RepID=A0ABY1CVB8_MYXFU|nr:TAP-like protein [Myxococcus fulvus]